MKPPNMLLPARVLRQPGLASAFSPHEWDLLIRQARAANVLARIATVLDSAGVMESVPIGPRGHLVSAAALGRQQQHSATYEIDAIRRALIPTKVPLILLKGAAYLANHCDAASGRLFADVDILVPSAELADVESALVLNGWLSADQDPYDQRYYRRWMHELPPMQHMRRGTSIDVHHTILPPTAGRQLDASKLIASARPSVGAPRVKVLTPVDMVLHSMTHLFYDGELEHGFRDLVDLDSLLLQYGADLPDFWASLWPRAQELDLERPLYYGLRYAMTFMGTPVPQQVLDGVASAGPTGLPRAIMDALFLRALRPAHASCADRLTPLARWLLYVRSHWLRMPAHLLVWHLCQKALRRPPEQPEPVGDPQN